VLCKIDKARETYKAAVEAIPQNLTLWSAFINFEFSVSDARSTQASVQAVYTEALSEQSKLEFEDREQLWTHFLDYLEDFCADASSLLEAKSQYKKWKSSGKSKKRSLDNGTESQNKIACPSYKSDGSAAASGAYYAQQAGYTAPAGAASNTAYAQEFQQQAYAQPSAAGYTNQAGYQQPYWG